MYFAHSIATYPTWFDTIGMDRSEYNAKLPQNDVDLEAIDKVLYSGFTGMLSLRLNKDYKVDKF